MPADQTIDHRPAGLVMLGNDAQTRAYLAGLIRDAGPDPDRAASAILSAAFQQDIVIAPGEAVDDAFRQARKDARGLSGRCGPKKPDHPSVGRECPACHEPFAAGDYTVLLPLGPGADPDAQQRARAGRPYNAPALELHWTCATGQEADDRG